MSYFILGCLFGIFIGAGISWWLHEQHIKIDMEKMKEFINYFFVSLTFTVGLLLYFTNSDVFLRIHEVESFEDLQGFVFSNPVIQQLIVITLFAFLLAIISFIIRFPFFKWEEIKIFGFEAKAAIKEKAEKQAKEELDYMYIVENLRLASLELFTSELTYDIIIENLNIEERIFNGKQALEEILESFCILYRESPLNCSIRYGVLTIHHDEISVADYEHYMRLPNYLKEDIDYAIKTMNTEKWNHVEINTFVTPFSFLNDNEVYYMIYLSSYEIEFNSLTEKQFQILKNLIEVYIKEVLRSSTQDERQSLPE